MSILKKLFARDPNPAMAAHFPAPAPLQTLIVLGDLHGRADLLEAMLAKITSDQGSETSESRIVTVGDYIDRGDESAKVLALLRELSVERSDLTCLLGNHEKMMLDFLENPEGKGPRWLRNGGLQTLASYKIGGVTESAGPAALVDARNALRERLPVDLQSWLSGLPKLFRSGNLVVTHAAMDPSAPLEAQSDRVLLWGHHDFLKRPRTDGLWVAHGHTVFDIPQYGQGRISCDTGAYFSGKLTAAVVSPEGTVRFLQT